MQDKKTTELTGGDWLTIRRHGSWHKAYDQEGIKLYLEANLLDDILFSTYKADLTEALILQFCVTDFFKENNYEITRIVEIGNDGEYIPKFKNIEYEQKKFKNCLQTGSYLFQNKEGAKFILTIEPYQEWVSFSVASLKSKEPSSQTVLEQLRTYAEKHNFLKGKKIDAECNFIYFDTTYTWDDLILAESVKTDIRRNLSNLVSCREIYRLNNLVVKRGLIFSGPPGTGKSLLGKILCHTTDWTFVWVTPKHLVRSSDVSKVVSMCRNLAPAILFLEDIDLYGKSRSDNSNAALLGEVMNQLDGIQENKDIITIGTTNDAKVLEEALLDRPGRFDKVIELDKPNKECRIAMVKRFTSTLNIDKLDWEKLGEFTNNLTGAHIKELVNFAVLLAIDDQSYDENKKLILKEIYFKQSLRSVKKKDFSRASSVTGFGKDACSPAPVDWDW